MNPIDRTSIRAALLCRLLLWLATAASATPAFAETTRCVDTTPELLAALDDAEFDEMRINLVRGTYLLDADYTSPLLARGTALVGGWDAGCDQRLPDPRLTTITGDANLTLHSDDFLRVESIAFVDGGKLELWTSREEGTVTLRRIWLENLRCAGEFFCDIGNDIGRPVQLYGNYVRLDHVVATDHPPGCVVTIQDLNLREASVAHSLFTGNSGRALCVERLNDAVGYSDEFDVVVDNSVFWNNGLDLYTRGSPLIRLRNNIYERLDVFPASSIAPVQTLDADPQFQDVANQDFRLLASSPAVDSGRFGPLQISQEFDLVGSRRVIGQAPDRGPFELASSEAPLIVTNTLDTLAPVALGSLRWAIAEANARPGLDRIRFALPACPQIIDLAAPLPDITDSVFIDGYSQAGSARNESVRGFAPTLCVGVRAPSQTLDHALRIPAGAADDTLLWVSGLALGGFDIAAVRIAAGSNSWVFGNQFGGSLGGTALGNNAVNVRLGGTSHENLIGGSEVSQRNLIASAYDGGIELLDNSSGDEGYGNTVRNNFIGTTGQGAAPNALGVRVRTDRNTIRDNYISANLGDGVLIEGPLAFDNEIRDNAIGLKTFAFCFPPCTPDYALGNTGAGVRVTGGGRDNAIRFNRIAHSGAAGVRLEDGLRNLVWSNSITGNGALGIDLGTSGVNPVYNSSLAVTGTYANRGLNAPTLSSASGRGSGGRVTGATASRNGTYLVQIFRNTSCDASGRGEGATLLATGVTAIANAPIGNNGSATFDVALPSTPNLDGATLTATLVDQDGNTSEFSACRAYETILCQEIFRDGFEDNLPPPACTTP